MTGIYAIILARGASWIEGPMLEQQAIGPHRDYLRALANSGVVIAAGPLPPDKGGLILIRAHDDAEAERVMRDDPGIRDGVFTGAVHRWNPLIDPARLFAEGALLDEKGTQCSN